MRQHSTAALKRLATEVGGKVAEPEAVAKAVATTPAPAGPSPIGRDDASRMLDELDALWQSRVDALQQQVQALMQVQLTPRTPTAWRMNVQYGPDGEITDMVAEPVRSLLN